MQQPFMIFFLITDSVILAGISLITLQRRYLPGAFSLSLLTFVVTLWLVGDVFELANSALSVKLFWANFEYFGMVGAPLLWLIFTLQYTGRKKWITPKKILLMSLIPGITLVMVWTNPDGLMHFKTGLDTGGPFPVIAKTYGAWFWVYASYSYLLIFLSSAVFLEKLLRSREIYRGQAMVLFAGGLIPWAVNLLYVFKVFSVFGMDPTPYSFLVSTPIIAGAFFHNQLFNVVPLTRDALIDGMSDGVMVLDAQDRLVDFNPVIELIADVDLSKNLGKPVEEFVNPMFDVNELLRNESSSFNGSREIRNSKMEISLEVGGAKKYYDLKRSAIYRRGGKIMGNIIVLHEITEQKKVEMALLMYNERIENLHETASSLENCKTDEEVYGLVIDAMSKVLGFSKCAIGTLNRKNLTVLASSKDMDAYGEIACNCDAERITDAKLPRKSCISDGILDGTRLYKIAVPIDESRIAAVYSPAPFTDDDVRMLELLIGHTAEALKRIKLQNELKEQAIRDPLTGLYNRRYLEEAMRTESSRAKRYDRPIGFVMVDIDRFKMINDRFGHQIGDQVLQDISGILRGQLRGSDVVARYGGDEFLIMLSEANGNIERVIERIKKSVSEWNRTGSPVDFPISLAFGTSSWHPGRYESVEAVLNMADQKMYEDKRKHKNHD